MMKKLFTLLLGLSCTALSAQSLHQIQVDVVYLASELLAGRETGQPGEQLAAEHIAARFADMGLKPAGTSYYQTFDFSYSANPHATEGETRTGRNVVGLLDFGAASTVVIGAHYDHLGSGATGSLHAQGPAIHNGADDNASGVAALLYLAEKLASGALPGHNYVFVAFSGEELGLYGSKHYVKHPAIPNDQVSYMINMDMVGRLDAEHNLVINGVGTSPRWKTAFEQIEQPEMQLTTTESGVGPSDHTSFYLADIPAIHFFTGTHSDYHKPSDDSPKVNFEGIQAISEWIYALIAELDTAGKLAFSKTKEESQRQASAFKVSLGVMPDYTGSEAVGMRIDAVLEDRPAIKAGLLAGDVIIQIGEVAVKDIYDYMEGLSAYEPGQQAEVKVRRGEEELTFTVQF